MREILFRGKRKTDNKWLYGFPYITRKNAVKINWYCSEFGSMRTDEVDPETVGQYTGLTDKNGTKIFEGDIVKFIHKNKLKPYDDLVSPFYESYSRNYKIEYTNTFARYGLRFINGSIHFPCKQSTLLMHDCEIIGNIYDNPELLGESMKPASKNVAQSGLAPATENFELLEG